MFLTPLRPSAEPALGARADRPRMRVVEAQDRAPKVPLKGAREERARRLDGWAQRRPECRAGGSKGAYGNATVAAPDSIAAAQFHELARYDAERSIPAPRMFVKPARLDAALFRPIGRIAALEIASGSTCQLLPTAADVDRVFDSRGRMLVPHSPIR
jgi:hypothetical protein